MTEESFVFTAPNISENWRVTQNFLLSKSPPSHFSIGEKTQEIHCKASSSERNSDRRVHGGENRELISN